MRFLANQVNDPATSAWLVELADAHVDFLDLSDPKQSELVDIIVDQLPTQVAGLEDVRLRNSLAEVFEDLYRFAREQQDYNRDPTQQTYFTIGPNPARYFNIAHLKRGIDDHLDEVNFVRIDVSNYTSEQRIRVREYLAQLANPRVFIVGDEQ